MNKIVGVRLKTNGKIYEFDSGHFVLKKGDGVVVETEQGIAFGRVCVEPRIPDEKESEKELKQVHRIATDKDVERDSKNHELEKKIHDFCYGKITELGVPMSLVAAECLFDGSKVIIYFSADGRVDFRELVKELVQKFHTRIEMRQIGVRHQAKMVGGIGPCGLPLCCSSFLSNFEPVSIKMAKKQNLSLNPTKISGMCGRLMCCLSYEHSFYDKATRNIPQVGKKVETTKGKGKVLRHNVLKESLTILLDSYEEVDITYSDIVRDNRKQVKEVNSKQK